MFMGALSLEWTWTTLLVGQSYLELHFQDEVRKGVSILTPSETREGLWCRGCGTVVVFGPGPARENH